MVPRFAGRTGVEFIGNSGVKLKLASCYPLRYPEAGFPLKTNARRMPGRTAPGAKV